MLQPGRTAEVQVDVTPAMTAAAVGSGDVEVLATPSLLAICEAATVAVVAGEIGPEQTTVGTAFDLRHLAPTTVGATVVGRARLVSVEGRELEFAVEATAHGVTIGSGSVLRRLVQRDRFEARAGL